VRDVLERVYIEAQVEQEDEGLARKINDPPERGCIKALFTAPSTPYRTTREPLARFDNFRRAHPFSGQQRCCRYKDNVHEIDDREANQMSVMELQTGSSEYSQSRDSCK
jgi:hypothetical protein